MCVHVLPSQEPQGRNRVAGAPRTNQVQTSTHDLLRLLRALRRSLVMTTHPNDPLQHLLPDSDEEGVARVTEIRVKDQESRPQLVRIEVGGVPLDRVVDTSADTTMPTRFQMSRQNPADI